MSQISNQKEKMVQTSKLMNGVSRESRILPLPIYLWFCVPSVDPKYPADI